MRARARILEGHEAKHVATLLGQKYGFMHSWLIPAVHRLMGWRTVHSGADRRDGGTNHAELFLRSLAPPALRRMHPGYGVGNLARISGYLSSEYAVQGISIWQIGAIFPTPYPCA